VSPNPQFCSEPECDSESVYRTRTRPAWCDEHITAILHAAGLEPLEPFTGVTAWRLTRCLDCGCEAHYRLEYTLDGSGGSNRTCRACYWRQWAAKNRRMQGPWAQTEPVNLNEVRALAAAHSYEYLGALTSPSLPDEPHLVACTRCGRRSAERTGDITWGCQCKVGGRRSTLGATKPAARLLLRDSGDKALAWWDHDINDPVLLATLTSKARREVAWRCPTCDRRFTAKVNDVVSWTRCPERVERQSAHFRGLSAIYERTPVADVPELAAAWADEADPRQVMVGGGWQLYRFRCPKGHHPRLRPWTFLDSGCSSCAGQAKREARFAERAVKPDAYEMNREIAAQWHPLRNGPRSVSTVSPNSRKTFWWIEPSCGHEWEATPVEREKRHRWRCPVCETILDSVAYHFPELAEEWGPSNSTTPWHLRPTSATRFTPEWVCMTNPAHVWRATLASRTAGSGCPECKVAGKSAIEMAYFECLFRLFGSAASGRAVKDAAFGHRGTWHPDVSVDLPDGRTLYVEYDGSYWHASKVEIDTAKSHDLLATGALVVRLREHPLPGLDIDKRRYLEVVVHAVAPAVDEVVEQIVAWVNTA